MRGGGQASGRPKDHPRAHCHHPSAFQALVFREGCPVEPPPQKVRASHSCTGPCSSAHVSGEG